MIKTFVQTVIYKNHLFLLFTLLLVIVPALIFSNRQHQENLQRARTSFITSIDTMKESKDTSFSTQLTDEQIANDVNLSASLNPNYLALDTHYNDDTYMARWVRAIRATGKHVWFRPGFAGWGTGTDSIITPTMYLNNLRTFILTHPGLFQPGDIFDENAEPENGRYWAATYGTDWSSQAPNRATDDFNSFLVGLTDTANQAFQQLGIKGVITTIHSTDPWTAEHPEILYPSTVQHMGNLVTVDAYPDADTTDPAAATNAWVQQLMRIHAARPTARILIGEMGYSNEIPVDDKTQEAVLKEELNALSSISYLAGINYWVGAGTDTSGGYTHIFTGNTGHWSLRPAAHVLASFYSKMQMIDHSPTPTLLRLLSTA
ncbi:MAG TPA: hypothetical protein VEL31_07525 [Ktedonobacteraceae bacterium]|nr:hypothetical protein [Ktedonobacteraceae bacterium]